MPLDNNPLKQYFRRPAVYIKLPSGGKLYSSDVVEMPENGELPVYPMTAIDEITAKTPDALFNGTAVNDIIKSCIPNIKNPWKLFNIDLNPILVAIKSATNGNMMEMETVCPSCEKDAKYEINLAGVLANVVPANYDEEISYGELQFKFKPLTFKEMNEISLVQFDLQKIFSELEKIENVEEKTKKTRDALKTVTEVTINAISKTIAHIKTPTAIVDNPEFIVDFLKGCDKNIYEEIKKHVNQLREKSDLKPLKVKCIHCSHNYEQPFTLNMTDFFD